MDIRRIETDDDHRAALTEIEKLWGAKEGTPEGERLDVLVGLVEAYEAERWPMAREAARQLAALGGSEPDATAAPRRRFW